MCNVAIRPFVRNMENQKRFITNAGHELKTPIAIISANAEAIEMLNGRVSGQTASSSRSAACPILSRT